MDTSRAISRIDSLASLRRKALPLSLSLLLCGALAGTPAQAASVGRTTTPTGGTIVGGTGSILQNGASVVVNQASNKLVLNWQSFNLGQDASVLFKQPGSSAVALNRILDQNPSQIFGRISSNGQVFLINTHGIIFGTTAKVNVGGLVASTLDLTPTDFLSDHFNLNAVGGNAGIVNHGTIAAASGGSVSLIGGSVANDGVILANYGRINLDGAEHAVLDFDGNGLINVQITGELKQRLDARAAVTNAGTLQAEGGTVVLQAAAARDLFTNLVNNAGVIDAGGISHDGGVVRLVARGGDTVNSGHIDATGTHGGSVQLLSDRNVGVTGGSIDASGAYGGGDIRVGGGWQGGEGLQTADAVYVAADASLAADATQRGGGGSVVVWGNRVNNFHGDISARGGAFGGDGGRVETSSHDGLNAQGRVDASAPHGRMGTWLLDPYNVTISDADKKVDHTGNVYSATGNPSTVSATNIGTALTGGTSVYVFTGSSGTQEGNITVDAPVTATGVGQLYLQAAGSIYVNDDIKGATGNALNVYLWANYNGSGGANSYTKGSCTACLVSIGDGADAVIDTQGGLLDIRAPGAVKIGKGTNDGTIKTGTLTIGSATHKVASVVEGSNGTITANTVNVSAAGAVTLDNAANAIANANLSGSTTAITTTTNLVLGTLATGNLNASSGGTLSFAGGTVDGNLLATSSGNISQGGALTVTGSAGFDAGSGTIMLTQANNDFGGAVSLTGGTTKITDTDDLSLGTLATGALTAISHGALDLGGGIVGGALTATSNNHAISQSGTLTVTGLSDLDAGTGNITLANTGNDFTGAVTLAGDVVKIADTSGLSLGTLDTGDLTVGSGGTLSFAGGSVDGDLAATSAGDISQGGALTVTGSAGFDAGTSTIMLTQANNDFGGAVSLTGGTTTITDIDDLALGTLATGDFTVTSTGALTLGKGTVSGTLAATSNNGAIGQVAGGLSVTGTSTLEAGTGAIVLNDAGNDFAGAVSANGQGVALRSSGDLTVAALDSGTNGAVSLVAGGTLDVSALGAIATGTGDLTLGAGDSLTIDTTLSGHNVSLSGGAGLTLNDDVTATGTLHLGSTNAAIVQTGGALAVTGASTVAAGTGNVTLDAVSNNFQGTVNLTGGTVQITDANDLALGTLATGDLTATSTGNLVLGTGTVTGNLVATSQGNAISQAAGGLAVTGTSTLDAGTGTITLKDANNDFGGAVNLTGGVTQITDTDDLALGTLATGALTAISHGALSLGSGTVSGALTATSNNHAIGQAGTLTVTGLSDIDAGTDDITLANAGNDFGGAVSLAGDTVAIVDVGALALGALDTGDLTASSGGTLSFAGGTVDGNLLATSSGNISQGGALTVTGSAGFDAGSGTIMLTQANNDFGGAVSLTGGTTKITDTDDLSLGTLATGALTAISHGALDLGGGTVGGALTATSNNHAISQSGTLTVTGLSDLDAGTGNITLANTGNDFTGAVTLAGDVVKIADTSGLSLGMLDTGDLTVGSGGALAFAGGSVDGDLAATSAGDISQGGALTVTGSGGFDAGTGTIMLTQANNDFGGAVSLTGGTTTITDIDDLALGTLATGDFTVTSTGALTLGKGTVSGTLAATSNNGAIGQVAGGLAVTGTSTLDAGTGAIVLNDAGNDFAGAVSANGQGVALRSSGDLTVAALDSGTNGAVSLVAGGTLDVSALGAIATGTGDLTLGAGDSLTIDTTLSGHNVSLSGGAGLTLNDDVTATGTLHLGSTNAAIVQTGGALAVTGASTVAAGTGNVTLDAVSNNFQGTVNLTGGTVQITDANDLALGTLATGDLTATSTGNLVLGTGTVTGNLVATSQGNAISQAAGGLAVTGTSTLDAGTGTITLKDANNDFGGAVNLTGGVTQITDTDDLALGTLATGALTAISHGALSLGSGTVSGALTATSNNHAIGQAGTLTVTGLSDIDAGTDDITLANAGNDFGGAVSLSGDTVAIVDVGALALGTLDTGDLTASSGGTLSFAGGMVDGNLLATSSGNISQGGALTVVGASTIDAGPGSITLADTGNDFKDSMSLAGNGISVRDANDLTVAALGNAANSPVSLVAGGSLALPAAAIDTGTGDLLLAANGGTLDVQGALAGANVSLSAHDGLTLGQDVTATGTLALASATGDIDQTAGVLTATTLTGNAGGQVTLGQANAIAQLGSFSADGFSLANVGDLVVTGPVDGGTRGVTIHSGGMLGVAGDVSGASIALQGDGGISQSGGSIDAGTGQVSLQSAAGIAQNGGSITAGTLVGSAVGGVTLAGDNRLAKLGSFSAASLSLNNTLGLTLAGPVTTSGDVALATGGDLAIQGVLEAANVALDVDGKITEGASGNLVTGSLGGQASGTVALAGNNHVGTLGNFSAAGLALTNGQALTVNGNLAVGTGNIALTTTAGALTVNAALSGGGVALDSAADLILGKTVKGTTVSLASAGSISQTATGLITAGTLTGHSAGATTLDQANAIGALGSFTAHGLKLTSNTALTVAGTVDGGTGTTLAAGGNLRINGTLKGGTTTLSAAGAISQGSGGAIVANTLRGQATGAVALDGANHIGTLGNFQSAGFSLHDAQNLTVTGTLDGGGSTALATTGNLVLDGTVKGGSTRVDVGGALSETSHGRIVADTLAGHVAGAAVLTGANAVGGLGNFNAASLALTNGKALTIGGTVDGGATTTLKTTAGGLTVNGSLAGTSTTLAIAGSIDQGSHGRITAATLSGQAGGDVALEGANRIGTLGSFSARDFALSNAQALIVNGPLKASGGDIALATTAGKLSVNSALSGDTIVLDSAADLALGHAIHGGTVSLRSGGRISQSGGGVITADRLSGHSAGSTTLEQANAIGTLGEFSADGLSLATGGSLTVDGPVDGGGSTRLATGGDLHINGTLTGDTTTLAVNGAIDQGTAGSIVAHTLTGRAGGAATLDGYNRIDTLGAFSAAGFALGNGPSLTVAGPLDGGRSVSLTTTRGDLAINGAVSGTATVLVSSGAITEGQGGGITAGTLSGRAGGRTQLGTASSPLANYIGTLGGFSSPAGFSLTNAQTLTLASVGGSSYTVDAGTSKFYLGVTGGDLLQIGDTPLFDGEGTFSSTGRIGTSDAPIYVTGTGPQAVAMVGLPPAYFYAVNSKGGILPLTGGSSVNVPTSLFTSRAQNANNHTDVYIDPSVISANYRSFGIVPSGILLPADQQACDPEMEECDE